MRGRQPKQADMICLLNVEDRISKSHPLRRIKAMTDKALKSMSRKFSSMYSHTGRPSIPPERLLKGMLLMALYSIRSERQLCEQLEYNMLFRWFLDMDMNEPVFDHSTFSANRDRILGHDVVPRFFKKVVQQAEEAGLMSEEHFSVDGTLIDAWASMKSFRPKDEDDGDGNGWSDFRGQKRKNDTHESKTDPESRLMRKGLGKEAKLSFAAHALMENRNGLLKDVRVTQATGRSEREAALDMLEANGLTDITLGADAAYNSEDFRKACKKRGVDAHVAARGNSVPRELFGPGYDASQKVRKRIEQIFGWAKTTGAMRKTRFKGRARIGLQFHVVGAAYNLVRMAKMMPQFT